MSSAPPTEGRRRRIGIVGYGSLGRFLVARLGEHADLELAFVWNRSVDRLDDVPPSLRCERLDDVARFSPDIIVEVCHPGVSAEWGAAWLRVADVYVGSPTALADAVAEAALRAAAATGPHGLYVPAGALWGSLDLARMSARGSLASLSVTMKKHPLSMKLEGALGERVAALLQEGAPGGETTLYDGPVRGLCPLAPNNVNTMASAAIAAPSLGFDGVRAVLVADASLQAHVITIEATGPPAADGSCFRVVTERVNPAPPGAVTGQATFASFLSSLLAARGHGPGVHLC